jgi:hypothetical protein
MQDRSVRVRINFYFTFIPAAANMPASFMMELNGRSLMPRLRRKWIGLPSLDSMQPRSKPENQAIHQFILLVVKTNEKPACSPLSNILRNQLGGPSSARREHSSPSHAASALFAYDNGTNHLPITILNLYFWWRASE